MKASASWFVVHHPNPQAKLRLFCFPYAGGSTSVFKDWGKLLKEIEVYTVQLPGRGIRLKEPAFTRMEPLVENLIGDMLPLLDRPFILFGHSLGGLIAFQTSRLLEEQHQRSPVHLFISGRNPPHIREDCVYNLSDREFVELLHHYNGTPNEVLKDANMMSYFLPILRADFQLSNTYELKGEPKLSCPLSVYGGTDDPLIGPEALEEWERYAKYRFSVQLFAGDHFYLNFNQAELLDMLYNEAADSLYAYGFR
ncbi:alpha/beta fold hydrolase [Paenibacillus macerans]|nr:alpha/beta fold hydrolase [Paenibacillus macerans]